MLFDISSQPAVYNERIAIILGLVTLVLALAIFASCRTFVSLLQRLGLENPSQNKFYQGFYKYHLYYWWGFGVSLLAHVMMVTLHTGLPRSGDPDAGVHWVILILGLASAVSGVVLFFSCRILPRLLAPKTPRLSLSNKAYKTFFTYHTYHWWTFALFVAAHFIISYIHAGVWPGTG
jgi:hypothetical protein